MYLIIGASSFIGRHLYEYCKKKEISVLGTYYTHMYNAEWIKFDLCRDDLGQICCKYGVAPEAVIVCGANTSIDDCKKNEFASTQLNVIGTERIFAQAEKIGAKSVFLSSEAVFDGKKGMYTEEDRVNPVTLYGKQKLQVEQYIEHNLSNYLVFRVSRATGSSYGEKDIFNEFYNKIINQEEIICLKDQTFCLTEVDDIVENIIKALQKNISGLYHMASENYVSRYDLAKLYAKIVFGGYDRIVEKECVDFSFIDNRHIYGGLKGKKLADLLHIRYMDTMDILNKYYASYIGR